MFIFYLVYNAKYKFVSNAKKGMNKQLNNALFNRHIQKNYN